VEPGFADTQLRGAGFAIKRAEEAFPSARFTDVGAIVYDLRVISWQIPEFSDRLGELDRRVQAGEAMTVHSHRFLLDTVKPAGKAAPA